MNKTLNLTTEISYDDTKNYAKKIYDKYDVFRTFSFTRNAYRLLSNDQDAQINGIYFVFSTLENKIYVGKSENGISRIFSHDKTKEFWNRGMLFTHPMWGPSEISYFEYYFTNYFMEEDIGVVNIATVNRPNISEID